MKWPKAALEAGLEAVRAGREADLGIPVVIVSKDDLATLRNGTPTPPNDHPVDRRESEAA